MSSSGGGAFPAAGSGIVAGPTEARGFLLLSLALWAEALRGHMQSTCFPIQRPHACRSGSGVLLCMAPLTSSSASHASRSRALQRGGSQLCPAGTQAVFVLIFGKVYVP